MAHAFGRLLPKEIALLGLAELAISFILILTLVLYGGLAAFPESAEFSRDCVILSIMLAMTIAVTRFRRTLD